MTTRGERSSSDFYSFNNNVVLTESLTIYNLFQTEYSIVGFVDRHPGATKDTNHYVTYKLINDNWILFNDNLVQYQRNIGIVHRVNLVIYWNQVKQQHTVLDYVICPKDKPVPAVLHHVLKARKLWKEVKLIYKTKLTTDAEDLAGFLIFKISTNLIKK